MNNPDENANIVKVRFSVVLQGRDLKFWEKSKKKINLEEVKFSPRWAELRKSTAGWILELSQWEL